VSIVARRATPIALKLRAALLSRSKPVAAGIVRLADREVWRLARRGYLPVVAGQLRTYQAPVSRPFLHHRFVVAAMLRFRAGGKLALRIAGRVEHRVESDDGIDGDLVDVMFDIGRRGFE
jgi:hypothetical protein